MSRLRLRNHLKKWRRLEGSDPGDVLCSWLAPWIMSRAWGRFWGWARTQGRVRTPMRILAGVLHESVCFRGRFLALEMSPWGIAV
jgi:hypothetical protein